MALDMNKLKQAQADLDSRGNDKLYLTGKKMGAETDFRIAPPKDNLQGSYFLEVITYWIVTGGKKIKLICPSTFGQPSDIAEELEIARASGDPDLIRLCDDSKAVSRKSEFLIPGWQLEAQFTAEGLPASVKVIDDMCKVLQCGPGLMKDINRVVTGRNVMNGTPDGIADRVKGFNLLITKTGVNLDTEYGASAWRDSWEMDEKYYAESKIPDILKLVIADMATSEYRRGVIANYLYGEPLPEKPKPAADIAAPAKPSRAAVAGRGAAPTAAVATTSTRTSLPATTGVARSRPAAPAPVEEAQQIEAPVQAEAVQTQAAPATRRAAAKTPASTATGRGAAPAAPAAGRRSLVDDVDGLDD